MKKGLRQALWIAFFTAAVYASDPQQTHFYTSNSDVFRKPSGFLDALFDPSKFSMSHSYSLSFFSMGNQSLNQGLYLNTMRYQLSDPLRAELRVGFLHQPFGSTMNASNGMNGKVFIHEALVEYKKKDFSFSMSYHAYPNSMMGYGYYRRYDPMDW